MNGITKDDQQFLDDFFEDELTEENLKELDKRLEDPVFKVYYKKRLDQKYSSGPMKLTAAYLPMIILLGLTIIGIYLIIKSN